MKKITVILVLLSALFIAGCNNGGSASEDMKNQDSSDSDFVLTEESNEPMEHDSSIGETAQDNGQPLPEEIFGTWNLTEGLPPELKSYTLTITPEGSVEQAVTNQSGDTSTDPARLVSTDSGFAVVNDSGITLLKLQLENGQLKTDNFGGQSAVFSKAG